MTISQAIKAEFEGKLFLTYEELCVIIRLNTLEIVSPDVIIASLIDGNYVMCVTYFHKKKGQHKLYFPGRGQLDIHTSTATMGTR